MIVSLAIGFFALLVCIGGIPYCLKARAELGGTHMWHGLWLHIVSTAALAAVLAVCTLGLVRLLDAAGVGRQGRSSSAMDLDRQRRPPAPPPRPAAGITAPEMVLRATIVPEDDEGAYPRVALAQQRIFSRRDFPIYMRSFHAGLFHDRTWLDATPPVRVVANGEGGWVRLGQNRGEQVLVLAAPETMDPLPLPFATVAINGASVVKANGLYVPHPPTTEGLAVQVEWRPSYVLIQLDEMFLKPAMAEPALLEMAAGEVSDAVRALVAETTTAAAPDERLGALLRGLQERCTYSLDMGEWQEGVHPVVTFLEHGQRGHCQLFATAFALGARVLGYPSRICVGFCGGEQDASGHVVSFFAQDAHAWVQLKTTQGWIDVDPTPPAQGSTPPMPRRLGRPSQLDPSRMVRPIGAAADLPVHDGDALEAREPDASNGAAAWSHLGTPLVLVLLLGALVLLVCFTAQRRRTEKRRASAKPVCEPQLVEELSRLFQAQRRPWPRGITLREHIQRAPESVPREVEAAVSYLYGTCFEGAPRDQSEEKRLRESIRRHRDSIRKG